MTEHKLSHSFDEWCRGHGFSRASGYGLLANGRGPATFMIGNRRHVSIEADEAWVRQQEQLSKGKPVPVARLEEGKRKSQRKAVDA